MLKYKKRITNPFLQSRVYNQAKENRLLVTRNDWKNCHIHHNPNHWWGSEDDFAVVEKSYQQLDKFIFEKWG